MRPVCFFFNIGEKNRSCVNNFHKVNLLKDYKAMLWMLGCQTLIITVLIVLRLIAQRIKGIDMPHLHKKKKIKIESERVSLHARFRMVQEIHKLSFFIEQGKRKLPVFLLLLLHIYVSPALLTIRKKSVVAHSHKFSYSKLHNLKQKKKERERKMKCYIVALSHWYHIVSIKHLKM